MQMKKLFSISFGFVAAITMAMVFCLTGCASLFSFNGKFSEDEIVLEIGEEFLPGDFFKTSKNVEFDVEDNNIVEKKETGTYIARASGKTTLVAKSGNLLIDTAKIYVKYNFQTPTNLRVSNDGLITWNSCEISLDGENEIPSYTVLINGKEKQTEKNEYQLSQGGEFSVKVKANKSDRVNSSAYSSEIFFKYDTISGATGVKFESINVFGAQGGSLTWLGSETGVLTIGNIQQNVSGNKIDLDFSSYEEKSVIDAKLYLTDNNQSSKTIIKKIEKLYTQEPSIKNNEVYWTESNSIDHTLVSVKNVISEDNKIISVSTNTSVLEGLGEGIYTISAQAIGQEGYANGNVKEFAYEIGKIRNVDVEECSVVDGKLIVKFSTESEFNKKFIVKQNEKSFECEFTGEKNDNGKYELEKEFLLDPGVNDFTVQAIPTLGNKVFEFEGKSTTFAIKSDEEKIVKVYNVDEIAGLEHSLDTDGNSILTFENLQYANDFKVAINGREVEDLQKNIGENKTSVNVGKITKDKFGDDQIFNIELMATRSSKQGELTNPSIETKSLTMLSKPVMSNCAGGQNNAEIYSWQSDPNAQYLYQLYSTDETFSITGIDPVVENVTDANTKPFNAGYYMIRLRALPIDENNYLPSEEWGEDVFYYTEQIAAPEIRLDYQEGLSSEYSGYVVKIKTVEFGYEYKVLFGDDELNLGSVFNKDNLDELSFNLPASAELVGTKTIKVVAIAKNDALQKIHSQSTSILKVEKLTAPVNYSIEESSGIIVVKNEDANAVLKLYKNGTLISKSEAGEDAEANISTFDGEFAIQARSEGYDEFDGYTTNGTTKISSDLATFVLHRSQTPFNLVYNSGIVSFEHNDSVEKYVATIKVESSNGSIQKIFEPSVIASEDDESKKSFNLENEIATLRAQDSEFNSIFTQKLKITLSLYAYIFEEVENVYYLSSFDATAKYDSTQRKIDISKLDCVAVEYDYDNKVIYWSGDEKLNPIYDIYLDGELKATIKTKSASGKYEYDISGYDFSLAGEYEFYVIASSDNTLASDKSKNIVIRKISQLTKLDVLGKTDGYYAQFAFAAGDEGHINDVLVNDESIGAVNKFKLNSNSYSIVIIGENYVDANGDKIYYISSETSTFTITQLKLDGFSSNATISNKEVSWEDYVAEKANVWSLTSPEKNLKYMIEIYNGETLETVVSNIATNRIGLTDENLLNLAKGDYSIKLYAYISEYEIANGGSGYYGKVLLQEGISLKKLAQVEDLSVNISNEKGTIEEELAKNLYLSWKHDEISTSAIKFEIYVNDNLIATTSEKEYALNQSSFGKDDNTISIVAVSNTDIASNKTSVKISRYAQPEISIDDRGVLKITDKDVPAVENGYIIEITMQSNEGISQTEQYYTSSREYDLSAINAGINQRKGELRIRVIQRVCNTTINAIPTIAAETNKTVLASPTISQTASGFTISSEDDGVAYYVKCEAKNYDKKVEGSIFTYPDEWESGAYNLVVYAQRKDAIDSWKNNPITVNVNRIDAVETVKFALAENYLDYTLSWGAIEDVSGYEIEVFANDLKIGNTLKVELSSVKLSEIRKIASDFKSGEYVLSIRSLTNFISTGKTNSAPFMFNVVVAENTVDNVKINTTGKLEFTSNNKGSFYIVSKRTDSSEEFGELVESSTKEYVVPKYAGKIQVSIVQINNSTAEQVATSASGVVVNDAAVVANINKLQDIFSINKKQESGKIIINVETEANEQNRKFIVEHNGIEKNLDVVKNGKAYEFFAIDMVNLFDIMPDGYFEFSLISIIDGYARSNKFVSTIGYFNHNNSSKAVKQDEDNDYIILTGSLVDATITKEDKSITNLATAIHILIGDNHEVLTPVFGYWIEENGDNDNSKKYFSATNKVGEGITSTRCCAVNISELLNKYNPGNINIRIGFVLKSGEEFAVANYSEIYEYKILEAVDLLEIYDGNLKWSNTNDENTAFMLYFDGETQHEKIKVSASAATYYLGENVNMTEEFTAGIKVVSSALQVVPSKITHYKTKDTKISQLSKVESEMKLTDGVLQLEFNSSSDLSSQSTETNEQNEYSSIEERLENISESVVEFTKHLISDRLTQPFSFRLKDLEKLEFNLKFVEADSQIGTPKSYYTSVKAINILTPLVQDTLNAIYAKFSDIQITDAEQKNSLDNVYRMLTNSDYFTGVASSRLLFREIGQNEIGEYKLYPATKIPYGTYDVYIQQIGSAEDDTLNSQYKLAKQGLNVVNSPITRVDSEEQSGGETNIYYAKFAPTEGKTYTMALRDKITDEIIEYKISKSGDDYVRSTFINNDETKTLKFENGFVWIPLNGENGIIYDENVTNINGYNVVVKEYKKLSSTADDVYDIVKNGRSYGGSGGKFTIDEEEYSYTISNGSVAIDGVEIKDGQFYLEENKTYYKVVLVSLAGHNFDVDIYADGDSESNINGKSETISVAFLQFNIDSLKLENGEFKWENFEIDSKTYPSTVVTKQKNTEEKNYTTVSTISGINASFTPTEAGAYDYFKFFTKGEARGYEIKVDSDVYVVENLFKLDRPNIQVFDGKLVYKDNTATEDKRETKNLILSNNESEEKGLSLNVEITKKNEFTLTWDTGLSTYTKQAEGEDKIYNYRTTEQTATKFYAAVSGDDYTSYTITKNNAGRSDVYYSVSFGTDCILLQSNKADISAAKLGYDSVVNSSAEVEVNPSVKVEDGNIVWSSSTKSVANDLIKQSGEESSQSLYNKQEGELSIVYEVTIEFYHETSKEWIKTSSSTLYTTDNTLDSKYVVDPIVGEEFKYKISVRANVYAYTAKEGDITTIHNLRYKKLSNTEYVHSGDGIKKYILNGEIGSLGDDRLSDGSNLISRTQTIENFNISTDQDKNAGKLTWNKVIGDNIVYRIFAINNGNSVELSGETGESSDNIYFEMKEGQLSIDKTYNFSIIAYKKTSETEKSNNASGETSSNAGEISSNITMLHSTEDVKILPNITASDYEIKKVAKENNVLYFDAYFSRCEEEYGNLIKVYAVKSGDANGSSLGSTEGLAVNDGNVITVRAVPGESINPNKYLRSDLEYEISLSSVNWSGDDNYYFDSDSDTLSWTFGAEQKYRVNNPNGAEIYLNDEKGYYSFGIREGENITEKIEIGTTEGKTNKVGIIYEDASGKVIDGAYVKLDSVIISNGRIYDNTAEEEELKIYDSNDNPIEEAEISTSYQLSAFSFKILDTNPVTKDINTYYIPSDAVGYNGDTVFAGKDSAYYIDEECTKKDLVENGRQVEVNTWNTGDYQQVNGVCYLKSDDLQIFLSQTDENKIILDDITFQVGFTVNYSYYDKQGVKYDITDKRIYKNVPIGQVSTKEFNGTAVDESGIRVTTFQFPVVGKISNVEIYVRRNENNLASEKALKSETLPKEEFEMNLFERGDGTTENPYLISNDTCFKNMSYRLNKPAYLMNYHQTIQQTRTLGNQTTVGAETSKDISESETEYCFKQTENLELTFEGFVINDEFNGVFDGANKTISVNIEGLNEFEDDKIETKLPDNYELSQTFNRGASVFKKIGESGLIKNIDLTFKTTINSTLLGSMYDLDSMNYDNALIGGLVFSNLGKVDSVTLSSSTVVFESALKQSARLAVAPIVGVNKNGATAKNLISVADVEIKNDNSGSGQYFYYGGIIGFNNGTVQFAKSKNSSDTGKINVEFSSNSNGIVAVGGIAITSNAGSKIDMAINSKSISVVCNGGSSYAGGVVLLAVNATLYSCVNTANIAAKYAGGIAHAFYNAKVNTLVGLGTVNGTIQNLFAERMSFASTSSSSIVYSYSTYTPSGNFTLKTISKSQNIVCSGNQGYQIKVAVESGVYSADIVLK